MENFNSVDEILDFAIGQEQEAIDFYSELANYTNSNDIKAIYLDFVKEEMGHKAKLIKIKNEGEFSSIKNEAVQDLKISDYLVAVKPSSDMTYQEALIIVMKKEMAAYKLYKSLAKIAPNEELKGVFHLLAIEEANHKLQFEQEYDDVILKDN
jgi:rubrerythrin